MAHLIYFVFVPLLLFLTGTILGYYFPKKIKYLSFIAKIVLTSYVLGLIVFEYGLGNPLFLLALTLLLIQFPTAPLDDTTNAATTLRFTKFIFAGMFLVGVVIGYLAHLFLNIFLL
ncbi:MAG: hypothetical protein QM538_01470 [Methylacidiphilales bacterium]|nr:hypothetical protein [Candidatus Methylacidiphilales bacterium]